MKKFIVLVMAIIFLLLSFNWLPIIENSYVSPKTELFAKVFGEEILIKKDDKFEPFEIRGVNIGSSVPGKTDDDFAIDEETYLRWFEYIQKMGANTIRVYTIQNDDFYNAFYKYNSSAKTPLYILQGISLDGFSEYDREFIDEFLKICNKAVDVIHGRRKISPFSAKNTGHGKYEKDISNWVLGYILGDLWDDTKIAYAASKYKDTDEFSSYNGKYLYARFNANPFEVMLSEIGDKLIEYETERYGSQRMITFSNSTETDPFEYPEKIEKFFLKCATIDAEHIKTTKNYLAGQFASYSVYPDSPSYLNFIDDLTEFGLKSKDDFTDDDGNVNVYRAYLQMLKSHHSTPVVVSELGVSTARGMTKFGSSMTETAQGQVLTKCLEDIKQTGLSGGFISSWQDEWFKATQNTLYAVNPSKTQFWSDYQSENGHFGLLSFDPGETKSVCYVDGKTDEWTEQDKIQTGKIELSLKYDEKYIYFLIKKENLDFENEMIFIPIDVTEKTGSNYYEDYDIRFERDADFVIVLKGKEKSRVLVQERYESLRSTYSNEIYKFNTYTKANIPDKNSSLFKSIYLPLNAETLSPTETKESITSVLETGKLVYGNANPKNPDFNSLADFYQEGNYIEIRLPWQLLNFADPSNMLIHDDYYDGNYGVEYIKACEMYAGAGIYGSKIPLEKIELDGWGKNVKYHERLKSSYYIIQKLWSLD